MKYFLPILFLSIININVGLSQPNEVLKLRIDSLNGELQIINSQIELLYQKRNNINGQIFDLKQKIENNNIEFQEENGIPVLINQFGGILRNKPSGDEISKIPTGDTVFVFNWYEEPYFKVSYKGKIGFISYASLTENKKIKELVYKDLVKENPRLARLTQKYGKEIAKKLINGEYWIGMTTAMATESLGSPDDVNKSTGSWGIHEQWVYDKKKLYLYFENGKLSSFQN